MVVAAGMQPGEKARKRGKEGVKERGCGREETEMEKMEKEIEP